MNEKTAKGNQPPESSITLGGKLVVEYKGGRYSLEDDGADSYAGFVGDDDAVAKELNLAMYQVEYEDEKERRENMDYWYPRPYEFGKTAAERLGAKVLEYQGEASANLDGDGNPVIY